MYDPPVENLVRPAGRKQPPPLLFSLVGAIEPLDGHVKLLTLLQIDILEGFHTRTSDMLWELQQLFYLANPRWVRLKLTCMWTKPCLRVEYSQPTERLVCLDKIRLPNQLG